MRLRGGRTCCLVFRTSCLVIHVWHVCIPLSRSGVGKRTHGGVAVVVILVVIVLLIVIIIILLVLAIFIQLCTLLNFITSPSGVRRTLKIRLIFRHINIIIFFI